MEAHALLYLCVVYKQRPVLFPIGRIVRSGGMKAVRECYQQLGDKFIKELDE